jgi:hypothetical protein
MTFEAQRQQWMRELEVLRHFLRQGADAPDPELEEELAVALQALCTPTMPAAVGDPARRARRQIDQVAQGCIVTSIRGVIRRVNRAAERHLACPQLVGQPILAFISLDERQRFLHDWKDFKKTGVRTRSNWPVLLQPLEKRPSLTTMQVHTLRNEEELAEGFMWLFQTQPG